jgi:hypothetical protein
MDYLIMKCFKIYEMSMLISVIDRSFQNCNFRRLKKVMKS